MTHEYPMQVSNLRKVYRVPVREAGVGMAMLLAWRTSIKRFRQLDPRVAQPCSG